MAPAPAVAETPTPPTAVAAAQPREPRRAPRRQRSVRAAAKRKLFPTPAPLSDEERMLVDLAASHPDALLIRPLEQIEIKPIQIAPLQIDGGQ